MPLVSGPGFAALLFASALAVGRAAGSRGVRPGSAASRLPRIERWFGQLAFGLAALTWWGVLLAELGHFDATLPWLVPLVVGLGLRRSGSRRPIPRRHPLAATEWALPALVALAAFFYWPPHDVRCMARDPAVYELSGFSLAATGRLAIHDALLDELSPEHRAYAVYDVAGGGSRRFVGFPAPGPGSARVTPQFLPAYPVWSALLRRIDPSAAGATGPLGALLGCFALLLLGSRLFGPLVGSAGALLLSLHFVQGWFARQASAELVAQPLFLAGCWALLLARRHGAPFHAGLAGLCLGLTWLTKSEMSLLLIPIALLAALDPRRRARSHLGPAFWAPLSALAVHTLIHYRFWSWPYFRKMVVTAIESGGLLVLVVGAALVLVASRVPRLGSALGATSARRLFAILESPAARRALALALVGLVAWGYWVRPDPATWDSLALPQLALALGPAQLPLAVLGAAALVSDRRLHRGASVAAAFLLFQAGMALWLRLIHPELMWALRRYLVAVLPLALLCSASALSLLWRHLVNPAARPLRGSGSRRVARWVLAAGLASIAALVVLDGTARALEFRVVPEQQGCAGFLEALDERLPAEGLLLMEPETRSRGLFRFEAALALELGRRVARVPQISIDGPALTSLVREQWARGREVHLLTTGALSRWPRLSALPVADLRGTLLTLEETRDRLPSRVETLHFSPRLYKLVAGGRGPSLPAGLDVGFWDDLFVDGRSTHAAEQGPDGRSFRWTKAAGGFWLPGLEGRRLVLTLDSGHPWPWVPRELEVRLDGVVLGRQRLEQGWRDLVFEIPGSWKPGPMPYLELRTRGFYPASVSGGDDRRLLGVKVDRIQWFSD